MKVTCRDTNPEQVTSSIGLHDASQATAEFLTVTFKNVTNAIKCVLTMKMQNESGLFDGKMNEIHNEESLNSHLALATGIEYIYYIFYIKLQYMSIPKHILRL